MSVGSIELEDVLPILLNEITKNKDQQREVDELLVSNYRIPRGTFNEILVNHRRLEQLSKDEVIILVNLIYKVTNDNRIDPLNFYTAREMNKALKFKYIDEENLTLPYTIHGVLGAPSGRDYVTILSYREIKALWNSRIITYNFNTQRLSKKRTNSKGNIVEKADVNVKSVNNITRLMLEGKYKPDTILLNVLIDGNDHIQFEDGELTIHEGTTVNLIDGMHRVQAILNVLEVIPDYEGFMNVSIKYYPLSEAQFLLGQVNTINRFDKTLVKHYMGESLGAQIAKDLMNIPELKQRISIKTNLDKKLNYFTNFAVLSEAIESIFQPKNSKDRYDITEILSKFFGYMIPAFEEQFITHRHETANSSWINHHNTFVGFIVIAEKLYTKYGKQYPVDEIVRIVSSINLSKNDSEYNNIMTSQGKVNSNQLKAKIRKFFEEKVDELLE
ncbi:MAG: sulfur modification protein DndB [Paenibacillus sp.]|jgi:hypothetical protein|nr:sulfur modification protein DndB [Paenibacillus sp.]